MMKLHKALMIIGCILIMLSACEGMELWKNIACAAVGFPLIIIPGVKSGVIQLG